MPIFPDCYDEWSLCVNEEGTIVTLHEGTEEECREFAYSEYPESHHKLLYLMDWEGREWDV